MLLESNTDEVHNPVETMAVEMTLHVPVKKRKKWLWMHKDSQHKQQKSSKS